MAVEGGRKHKRRTEQVGCASLTLVHREGTPPEALELESEITMEPPSSCPALVSTFLTLRFPNEERSGHASADDHDPPRPARYKRAGRTMHPAARERERDPTPPAARNPHSIRWHSTPARAARTRVADADTRERADEYIRGSGPGREAHPVPRTDRLRDAIAEGTRAGTSREDEREGSRINQRAPRLDSLGTEQWRSLLVSLRVYRLRGGIKRYALARNSGLIEGGDRNAVRTTCCPGTRATPAPSDAACLAIDSTCTPSGHYADGLALHSHPPPSCAACPAAPTVTSAGVNTPPP
ncbi:hypothetical protein B0H17DRAFT_1200290 [Mycena rosella]|uniref:Uncharacterized protein n=1 Tax=Mycena rosella TaxID=1033263 RepID=A0AAD7GFN8_MYCRO|nr:hypothetical protein B0H17DRAFT_1200290 [Mycena rosella]